MMIGLRAQVDTGEFPSPLGDEVLKPVTSFRINAPSETGFPSPLGDEVLKPTPRSARSRRQADGFPSPLGDEVLKPLYLDLVELSDFVAFPSPLGDEVLKPYMDMDGTLLDLYGFRPLSGMRCLNHAKKLSR